MGGIDVMFFEFERVDFLCLLNFFGEFGVDGFGGLSWFYWCDGYSWCSYYWDWWMGEGGGV